MKLLMDTNIVIDFFAHRKPFEEVAKKMFILGAIGDFDVWIGASQVTDIFFLLTSGPARLSDADAKLALRRMREHVHVCSLTEADIDAALDSNWSDFEDACVYQCALKVKADAIITRNQKDFEKSSIKVFDCDEFFAYMKNEKGLVYELIPF